MNQSKERKVTDILQRQFPMTPSPFTFTLNQGSNDLLMKAEILKEEAISDWSHEDSGDIQDIKKKLQKKSIYEILKQIRHELLWNEEELKMRRSSGSQYADWWSYRLCCNTKSRKW